MFALGNGAHLVLHIMANGKEGFLQLPVINLGKEVGLVFHRVGTGGEPFLAVDNLSLGIMTCGYEVVVVTTLLMEYTQVNKNWLTAKAQEEGVKPLPKGIYYKVLAEGKADGKHPTPRSIVTAHYTGRTIDGKQFDSSRGGAPLAIRLCDLIEGWIIAMQQMCVGDYWEVYIPAEMGYGKFSQPGIPGGSTLIFEIELLGIA